MSDKQALAQNGTDVHFWDGLKKNTISHLDYDGK